MKLYPSIPPHLAEFALSQPIFFTGSAPTYGAHVNLSPKGLPAATFSIINPNLCAYIDSTGSGAETIAHIYENGRVTIMFCSFGLSPMIMRLFCKGKVVEWDQPEFAEWTRRMRKPIDDDGHGAFKGARAIIVLEVWKARISSRLSRITLLTPTLYRPNRLAASASLTSPGLPNPPLPPPRSPRSKIQQTLSPSPKAFSPPLVTAKLLNNGPSK